MTAAATSVANPSDTMFERPLLFGRSRSLTGIVCSPADRMAAAGKPTVVFLNSGIIHRVGPNRLYVNAARRLAASGFASLRFDLGGIGDSAAPRDAGTVLELVNRDISDAIDEAVRLSDTGSVVLAGLCSGADNALGAAVRDARVAGAVMIDANIHQPLSFHLHHYARRILNPRTLRLLATGKHPVYRRLVNGIFRKHDDGSSSDNEPVFLAPTAIPPRDIMNTQLRDLANRGCRMLFVFSGGLDEQYNHRNQFYHVFPGMRRNARVSLEYFGDADHTFSAPHHQRLLIDLVQRWIAEQHGTERGSAS